ncbi:MAG: HlyD family efflux transporter periplasmic adaptor subunit [Bacteroidetes bacterium]|nr:HlyD family efflux transporter periplasmic adaptor subunit [Bacteroidota bacterium]
MKDKPGDRGMDEQIDSGWWSRTRLLLVAAVVFLSVSLVLIYQILNAGTATNVDRDRLVISTVEEDLFQEFIQITGSLQPSRSIYLDAVEGGVIESILISSGSTVVKGDTILTLSNSNLRLQVLQQSSGIYDQINQARNARLNIEQNSLSLKERLASAENRYRVSDASYKRQQSLYGEEMISEQEHMEARENYLYRQKQYDLIYKSFRQDSIKSSQQLRQIDESLDRMQQSLGAVQGILDRLVVTAPMAGQLSTADLAVGQSVSSGERIGQIDNLDSYNVRVSIDEYNLSRISEGLTGTTTIGSNVYSLEIERVYPIVENGRFQVDMHFTGEAPGDLRRGQTLRIRLQLGNSSPALLIDRGGFYQQTGGNWVYKLTDNGDRAERQPIEIGRQNPDHFEVVSGLNSGDKVIISSYEPFGENETLNLQ